MQWLKGFESIEGTGKELSAGELIVTFRDERAKPRMRVQLEINGKKLAKRIKAHKINLSEKPAKAYHYVRVSGTATASLTTRGVSKT